MGCKGESKSLKVTRAYATSGVEKTKRFIIKPLPGKHTQQTSVSIGYVLRDILHLADNIREAKYIINNREIIVDMKKVKTHRTPVGLFDIIEIPKLNKIYKVVYVKNASLSVKEIDKNEAKYKICKIIKKTIIKGKKVQLVTNDGRVVVTTNTAYKPSASIKLDLEENTIKEYYPLEKDRDVLIIGGKHIGSAAKIISVIPGTMTKLPLLKVNSNGVDFETVEKNVIVIN